MRFTRAEVEQAIEDAENAIVEKRREIADEERALVELRAQLDGYCRASCDHGGGCNLPRHHEPRDRHQTAHCVFYDAPAPAKEPTK